MTPAQFQRVRELFEQALEAEPADVSAWLDQHASGDRQVRTSIQHIGRERADGEFRQQERRIADVHQLRH